jgi:ribosome biogenesis GTPase
LGYRIIFTSQHDIQDLSRELENQVSVFTGQSGVGKSSLIRKVLPLEQSIQTGDLSCKTNLGRHTTSNSRYYHLFPKGALIDSPGIREFSLEQLPVADIVYGFPEFRALTGLCKFRNCNHQDNPGCALVKSVREKPQQERRYHSLLEILH